MARISRHERKQRKKEIVWGAVALITALGILASAMTYVFLNRDDVIGAKTLSPAGGPRGHYVLLVDTTDRMRFAQKLAFDVIFRDIIEKRMPEGYLLSIFVMGEDVRANARPLIEICNPGRGADKSEWTANLERLRRRYEERFRKMLLDQAATLVDSKPAKISPILETLQMVGINAFRRHDVQGERRLIMVSDMLHHTPRFSMYRGIVDYETFAASGYARKVHAELTGVEVEIHYLINTPELQTRRNLAFWENHFNSTGAQIVAVRPMEG